MTLISSTLANLVNGVSQQPDSQRLPSQFEQQDNAYCTVGDGLFKRQPTEHVKVLAATNISGATSATGAFCHWFEMEGQTYVAVVTSGAMRIFDLTGVEYTVILNGSGGFGTGALEYLKPIGTSDVAGSFRALTLSDRVLFLNKTISPRRWADTSSSGVADREGLSCAIFVRQGDYSTDYSVTISAVYKNAIGTIFNYTSAPYTKTTLAAGAVGAADDIKTTKIAADLRALIAADAATINANVAASVTVVGSSIILAPGFWCTSLRVSVYDSKGNSYIVGVKDTVQQFTDLPKTNANGFGPIQVVGSGATLANPYYVTFRTFSPTATVGEGAYLESDNTRGDTERLKGLNANTMPFSLTKVGSAFTLGFSPWGSHEVGDVVSDPGPDFEITTGNSVSEANLARGHVPPILDMFLHKNRLGFIYGDKVCLSEHGEYFNFFRTTVTALLDTDPIYVRISHAKSSTLRSASVYQNNLVLFTDSAQFLLTSGDILTPGSAGATQISEFNSSTYAKPAPSGSYLFFPFSRGDYSGVREFSGYIDNSVANGGFADAADITGHVTNYIPSDIYTIAASTHDDVLVAWCPSTPSNLYVYKYYWSGEQKLQSAWMKFTWGSNSTINGISFVNGSLSAVVTRANITLADASVVPGGTHLEKLTLSPGRVDVGGNYLTCLDRRITEANCTISYNAVTDVTTFTLPYRMAAAMKVVTRPGAASVGQNLTVVSQNNYTLTVLGNRSTTPVYIGQPYTMRVRFSTLYYRRQLANGATVADQSGRLQLKRMLVSYADSAYFSAEVTPVHRDTFTHTMNGQTVGGGIIIGAVPVVTGTFSFPVLSKNDQVIIDLVSDAPLPCRFLAAEWTGVFTTKGQRV